MKIIVDADACPRAALKICLDLGKRHSVPVWTVASFEHNIDSKHHVVVGNSPQEVDIKLANLAQRGDVAVTQDWGLAALLLGRGVKCLSPSGRVYSDQNIDFLLEERDIKHRLRRGGGRSRGPKKRTSDDDRRFARALEQLLGRG